MVYKFYTPRLIMLSILISKNLPLHSSDCGRAETQENWFTDQFPNCINSCWAWQKHNKKQVGRQSVEDLSYHCMASECIAAENSHAIVQGFSNCGLQLEVRWVLGWAFPPSTVGL